MPAMKELMRLLFLVPPVLRIPIAVGVVELFTAGPRFGISYMLFDFRARDWIDHVIAGLFATAATGAVILLLIWIAAGIKR